jgi:hypothetical protein
MILVLKGDFQSVRPEPFPGELTVPFGDPGQQQGKNTDLDMSLDP